MKLKASAKSRARGEPAESAAVDAVQEFGEEGGGRGGVPYRSFAQPPARIRRVTIWHRDLVDGILLATDAGTLPKIGGTGMHRDIREDSFELAADEFLTGISIQYEAYLSQIVFHSNKRDYGPFGGIGGRIQKRLEAPSGRQVVGFKGRHWEFIDSIQLMVA